MDQAYDEDDFLSELFKAAARHVSRRRYEEKYLETRREKNRLRSKDPRIKNSKNEYRKRVRAALRAQGLTERGTPIKAPNLAIPRLTTDQKAARAQATADRKAQRQADLARRRAERNTPEHKEEKRTKQLIRYALDENFRLYHREKSKRRKATMKERHAVRVRARDIRARFAQFDGCAYCGTHGDMHMDHFIPLAGGGTHALGNLVPACPSCNYSKRDHDAEQWYRSQPFFAEKRWREILQVLGVKRGSPLQLALL
jgi:5-methylcytosine-specific restriction endonuclease McrA